MARESSKAKQKRREHLVDLQKEKRAELKKIIKSLETSEDEKFEAMVKLNKLSPNGSRVRLRNRCQLTGRPRGYLRKYKLSRICFREMANLGLIPGVYKASW